MTDQENASAAFDKLPPYFIWDNFFGQALVDKLLAHVVQNQARFRESSVASSSSDQNVNRTVRISSILSDFGDLKAEIKNRFKAALPEVVAQLKVPGFALAGTEREIVAHGNGAFYKRHIDTFTGASGSTVRALTAVYYFHAQPKQFSGGELRLLPLRHNEAESNYLDIEPLNDRALFFPSWVPHSVMPVALESTDFIDSRFAINCWYHKSR
jgi:SM-20-related protein